MSVKLRMRTYSMWNNLKGDNTTPSLGGSGRLQEGQGDNTTPSIGGRLRGGSFKN